MHGTSLHPLRHHPLAAAAAALVALAGCSGSGSPAPAAPPPSLAVAPGVATVQAGEATVPLTAALAGSTDAIAWTLSPPGTGALSATSGAAVTYTPPAVLTADTSVVVTASAAGLSRSATITVTPSVVVTLGASPRSASTTELTFAGAFTTPSSFDVYRSTAAGTVGTLVASALPGATSGWRDSGLAGGTTYQYTVDARAANGRVYRSAQIGVTTIPSAVFPDPPTGLAATFVPGTPMVSLDSYTLTWDPYPGATEYIVRSTPVAELVGDTALSPLEGVVTSPTLDLRTVPAGTTKYFWVVAFEGATGRFSSPAVVTVADGSLPGQMLIVPNPVLDVGGSFVDQDVFHLYFYGAPGAMAHHVYVGTDGAVLTPHTVPTPALDGPPNSLPIQLVKPGYFRMDIPLSVLTGLGFPVPLVAVEAVAPGGFNWTSATPWVAVGLPAAIPPPPPVTGLHHVRRNPTQNDLSWNAAAGATGYVVYRLSSAAAAPTPADVIATPLGTSASDTTAVPGTTYHYRVAYTTPKGGSSAPSEAERVQTLFGGPPWLNPLVLVVPFSYRAGLTWVGHNDGTSFNVYSWYGRSLIPLPLDPTHLELTVSPGPDGMTPWGASAVAPLTAILTPLPLPLWGCWWLREVYPDGTESPLGLPTCTAFPSP